jgi:CheY-like chemotaxis protein
MSTKIMIVDDEPAVGRLLHYQLAGVGYDVVYVQDGLQALEQVLLERPDLILLDVMMPLVSGWDVCRQVRATVDVPVIMLTGKSADADVVVGLEAGADDYVTKPFSAAQLRARIEAVLRRAGRAATRERRPHQAVEQAASAPQRMVQDDQTPDERQESVVGPKAGTHRMSPKVASGPAPRLGQRMREARQRRGLSLYQAERGCRVRWEFLQALEQENWGFVPQHQLRTALTSYAGYLGLDPRELPSHALRSATPPLHLTAVAALLLVLLIVGLALL